MPHLIANLNQDLVRVIFVFIMCILMPALIYLIFCWAPRWISVTLASLTAIACIVGVTWGWRHVVIKNVTLNISTLPESFKGYNIVQLSDLHLGTYAWAPNTVREIVDKVNALNPDLIVFTGDIVSFNPDELEPFLDILSELKAKDGVFSIMGNHDYISYRGLSAKEQAKEIKRLQDMERSMGWTLLLNENQLITRGQDTLAIVGVENDGIPPFPELGDLPRATKGVNGCAILLSHDPTHWRRKVLDQTDIPLTLSGHTHGTQFKIGKFSPASLVYDEWGGLYSTEDERYLYVSTGAGSNIPIRLGAWPEIVNITLN